MPTTIPTLSELAFMYGTDKHDHGYMPFYERYLPLKPKKILEVGVKEGASMKTWLKYFPETIIEGLDLFSEFPTPFEDRRVKWWKGDQTDQFVLEQIRREKYDCIIEDASHNCINHWVTLFSLISCCELYFIEDLFTCKDEYFRQGLRFEETVLGKMHSGQFPFNYILHEDKIAVIWK